MPALGPSPPAAPGPVWHGGGCPGPATGFPFHGKQRRGKSRDRCDPSPPRGDEAPDPGKVYPAVQGAAPAAPGPRARTFREAGATGCGSAPNRGLAAGFPRCCGAAGTP